MIIHSGVEVSRDIDGNFIFAFPRGFTKHDEEMFLERFYEAVKNPIFLATIPITGYSAYQQQVRSWR